MKTLNQILEDMHINCADDFYDLMSCYWNNSEDAILVYDTKIDNAFITRIWHNNKIKLRPEQIVLARLAKPNLLEYNEYDLFDDYELHQISRYYKGDWYEWLKKHNSYPLENRINDAGRIYFEQNWPEFYNNMEEKLMEAQKEVSNKQNKRCSNRKS